MGFLTEWLTNIILLILLATVLEMLLPRSALQRYVKMVVGILLLLLILQPLLTILSEDVESLFLSMFENPLKQEHSVTKSVQLQKSEIESGQLAYISERIAVKLQTDVEEELMNRFALSIPHINVEMKVGEEAEGIVGEQELAMINVQVQAVSEKDATSDQLIGVQEIEVVRIQTALPRFTKLEDGESELEDVERFLSEYWQIPEDMIAVTWKGGRRQSES